MRFSALISTFLAFSFLAQGQNSDTLYFEGFESANPNFTSTNTLSGGNQWQVNNRIAFSGSHSARAQPNVMGNHTIEFITDTFNVPANGFVRLEWSQIARLNFSVLADVQISTDGGVNWNLLQKQNIDYYGKGRLYDFPNTPRFINILTYDTGYANNWLGPIDLPAQNRQWKREGVDVTNLVRNQSNVLVKFNMRKVGLGALLPQPDGWYLDDILIVRDSCEQFKPQISPGLNAQGCSDVPLRGSLNVKTNNTYTVNVDVSDFTTVFVGGNSGIDSVTVFYRSYAPGNTGAWQSKKMTSPSSGVYSHDFTNLMPGDTLQYYIEATDKSCVPNTAHYPVINNQDSSYLIYPQQPQGICGTAFCGSSPGVISSFPWKADFENAEWSVGSGNGNGGSQIRGEFDDEGNGRPIWTLKPGENIAGYGWAVGSGSTPSSFTGPSKNNTMGGHKYLYVEANQGAALAVAQMITPCIDLSTDSTPKVFSYYYHRFGSQMTNMRIDIDTGTNTNQYILNYTNLKGQSQNSSSEAWKRKEINLAPFAGKVIRIRFLAVKRNTGDDKGDMAVDDLSIENAPLRDVKLQAAYDFSDSLGCFANRSQVPLKVSLQNLGQQTLDTVPVAVEVNFSGSVTLIRDTLRPNLTAADGTKEFALTKTINLSQTGNYSLKTYAELPQDAQRENDTAQVQFFNVDPVLNQFPLVEDFEKAGMPQSRNFSQTLFTPKIKNAQMLDWFVGEGFTPNENTGPLSGFYRKGKYAYIAGAANTDENEVVLALKSCVNLSGLNNPAISFAYHTYGNKIKDIELQARPPGGNWTAIDNISNIPFGFNEEKDDWEFDIVSLNNYKNESINLRFVASVASFNSPHDNLALDQIVIYDQGANDVGITAITLPGEAYPADTSLAPFFQPQVLLTNYGSAAQSNLKVEMSVRRLCDPAGSTKTYRDPGNSAIAVTGSRTQSRKTTIPLVIPKGACEVCAYVANNTGDALRLNDTVCRIITGVGQFRASYRANFDSCRYESDGFVATDGLLQWEKGIPSGSVISSAQSSPNAWVTNLNGAYKNQLDEVLRTPQITNVNNVVGAKVRFWQYMDRVPSGKLEYRANNTWIPLGDRADFRDWKNWYDSPFGSIGNQSFIGLTNGWILSEAPLGGSLPIPNILSLRFVLEASQQQSQISGEGWAIDDFEILIPPQHSVAPQQIILSNLFPQLGSQNFALRFKNTGERILSKWKVKVFVNGALQDSAAFTNQSVIKGNSRQINFPAPLNLTGLNNNVMVVTSSPNNKLDDRPQDDTAHFTMNISPTLDTNQACSDFENSDFLVRSFNKGNKNLWQRSRPQKATLNSAYSGNQAWITGATGNYSNLTKGSIYTPAFKIDKGICYQLSFFQQFATELNFDGGTVEFLIPGVTSKWNTLGSYNSQDSLWFNTAHIQALPTAQPGWSGSNGQWQKAAYTFSASDSGTVRFRFRFASGGSVTNEGWAIDDICLTDVKTNCDSVVSLREMERKQALQVYPNPASHTLHLAWNQAPTEPGLVQVINAQGKLMYSRPAWQSPELNIDVSQWSRGIYFVIVRTAGAPQRYKVIVQ